MKSKLFVCWLALVALALVVAGSCSIKHQSEQYECDVTADCEDLGDGRVCSDGLCVVPGGTKKDASIADAPRGDALPDAAMCPSQCTSCNTGKKECVIDCQQNPNACAGQMTCPAGYSCIFKCNTPNACRNGVNCQLGTSCQIECSGSFSCRNIACGTGPCEVTCSGNNSCAGIQCNQSCACDVKCSEPAACFNVFCTKFVCDTGEGCSSQPTGCDTCI